MKRSWLVLPAAGPIAALVMVGGMSHAGSTTGTTAARDGGTSSPDAAPVCRSSGQDCLEQTATLAGDAICTITVGELEDCAKELGLDRCNESTPTCTAIQRCVP